MRIDYVELVYEVYSCCVNLYKDFIRARLRFWNLGDGDVVYSLRKGVS